MLLFNTHLLGIASLLVAGLAAATRPGIVWRVSAAVLAAMASVIATGAVEAVHDAVAAAMKAGGLYQDHVRVQWAIMAIGGGAAATVGVSIGLRWRGPARVMLFALWALTAWFTAQAISLHAADVVLGHPVGPVMAVALGWLAGAATVVAAAIADARRG